MTARVGLPQPGRLVGTAGESELRLVSRPRIVVEAPSAVAILVGIVIGLAWVAAWLARLG